MDHCISICNIWNHKPHGAAVAQAGLIWGVNRDMVAPHKQVSEWPKCKGGLQESIPSPPASLSYQKMLWQGRGSLSFLLLCIFYAAHLRDLGRNLLCSSQKVVWKWKFLPHICVCHFSMRCVGFLKCRLPLCCWGFCTITCSEASDGLLKYKQQIRSTQT